MSDGPDVIQAFESDPGILALIGSAERIMNGSLLDNPPYQPPVVLVELMRGTPALEGETGILADRWDCNIGMITEGCGDDLEACIASAMEKLGFACRRILSIASGRPGWRCMALNYSGSRMRR